MVSLLPLLNSLTSSITQLEQSSPFEEGPALHSSDIIQHLDNYENQHPALTCAQPLPVSPFQLSPFNRRLEIEDVHNTMIHCFEELHATRYPLPENAVHPMCSPALFITNCGNIMRSIPFGSAASTSPVILAQNTSSLATIIPVPKFRKCLRLRPY
ncbi:hypothetical protein DFS33DRAFT_604699 [Desarmillaria ectypa]|nr:hypothetical protein DFS33DRAFT_604699 [Desarmillaria ectypa]